MGLDQYCYGMDFNEIASLDDRAFGLFNVNKSSFLMIDDKPYFIIDDDFIDDCIGDVASTYNLTDEQVDEIRDGSLYYYLLIDSQNKLYTTNRYDIWTGRKNNALQGFMEDRLCVQNCNPVQLSIEIIDELEVALNETLKHPLVVKAEQILSKKLLDCTYDDLYDNRDEINSIDVSGYEMPEKLYPAKGFFYGVYELGYEWLENLIDIKYFIDEFKATYKDFDYTFYSCWY